MGDCEANVSQLKEEAALLEVAANALIDAEATSNPAGGSGGSGQNAAAKNSEADYSV